MCCSHPWRAVVQPGEAAASEARIAPIDPELATRWRNGSVTRGVLTVLRQPGGRCGFVTAERACEVHQKVGVDALVSACRNFPRSVVAFPDAWEVAFTTACPTVSKMLVEARGPFAWEVTNSDDWHFPPRLVVPDRFVLAHQRDGSLAEVLALRDAWLACLTTHDVVQVSRALHAHPLRAAVDGDEAALTMAPLDPMLMRQVSETLAALPDSPWGGRVREIWRIAPKPLGFNGTMEGRLLARLAALHIVAAGIHDAGRVAEHLQAVGARLSRTRAIASGLIRFGRERSLAWRDAMVATAELVSP